MQCLSRLSWWGSFLPLIAGDHRGLFHGRIIARTGNGDLHPGRHRFIPIVVTLATFQGFQHQGLSPGVVGDPAIQPGNLLGNHGNWVSIASGLLLLLLLPPVTAFISLNFTGSTTFTSRSGVKREIYAYIPFMAIVFGSGLLLAIALRIYLWVGRL